MEFPSREAFGPLCLQQRHNPFTHRHIRILAGTLAVDDARVLAKIFGQLIGLVHSLMGYRGLHDGVRVGGAVEDAHQAQHLAAELAPPVPYILHVALQAALKQGLVGHVGHLGAVLELKLLWLWLQGDVIIGVQAVDGVVVIGVDFGVHGPGGLDVAITHLGFGHGVEKPGVHAPAAHDHIAHDGVDDDGLDHEQNAQVAGRQKHRIPPHAVGFGAAAGVAFEQGAQSVLAAGIQAHHVGEEVALVGHDDHAAAVAGQLLLQGGVGGVVHIQAGRAFFLEKGDLFLELEHGFLEGFPL